MLRRWKRERGLEWMLASSDHEKKVKLKRRYLRRATIGAISSGLSMLATGYAFIKSYIEVGCGLMAADILAITYAYKNMCKYAYWKMLEKI